MTSSSHGILQLILTGLSALSVADATQYLSFLPAKWAAVGVFVISTVQAGLAIYNHYFTPQGTPIPLPPAK